MNLNGKNIVITGGAQGLGFAMAKHFANMGANLALIDMQQEQLESAKAELGTQTGLLRTYQCNVTQEQEVVDTFKAIKQDLGQIDGLVNNAGILRDGLLLKVKEGNVEKKMSLQQFQSVIDVNLTGVFLCGREAAEHMVTNKNPGVIINMSSVARAGNMGQTNYAASKAGVVAMTTTWARELGRYGIRVAAIAPGVIRTAMTDAMKSEAKERLLKMKPVGRLGEAEEIAHTAQFIFENDFVTGRVMEIDGGISF